ncbi:hypothetical protein, partial [Streptomyces sp. NPDC051776]|uniref:hypothetical protein n=1 Tax=Streptomyces sp. NPDC051776 TaxID=3155414 RepID=UPI00344097F8
ERTYPGRLRRRDHTSHNKIISSLTRGYGTTFSLKPHQFRDSFIAELADRILSQESREQRRRVTVLKPDTAATGRVGDADPVATGPFYDQQAPGEATPAREAAATDEPH